MKELVLKLVDALKKGIEDGVQSVTSVSSEPADKIIRGFESLKSSLPEKLSSLQELSEIESVAKALDHVNRFNSGFMDLSEKILGPLLTDKELYKSILSTLEQFHQHATENPVVREAIDKLAHVKGYGGAAFHRIADGRHSFFGALEGVAVDLPDIPAIDRILGVADHLWHDFHSSVGIPVFSFSNQESFLEFCKSLHLSPAVVQDFLTVNSTELLTSALTILPTMFHLNEMQAVDFAKAAVKLGILTVSGGQAEVIGSLFSLGLLAKAFSDVYNEGEAYVTILTESFKEAGWTTASVTSFALLPFPLSISSSIMMSLLRTKIEADGIESVMEISNEYFNALSSWMKDLDMSAVKQAIG